MLVRGSNYVRMDMGKLLFNKNHHHYRRVCIIRTNVLLAIVWRVFYNQRIDLNNETNTHTNVHIQYSGHTSFTKAASNSPHGM